MKDSTSVVADWVRNTARGGRAKAARLAGDYERAYDVPRSASAAEKRRKAAPDEACGPEHVAAAAGALADHDAKEKKSTAKKRYATAAEYLREVLAYYGDGDDDKVSAVSCNLAAVLESIGDDKALREAKSVAEDAIARRIRASGAEAIELAALRNNAATICHKLGSSTTRSPTWPRRSASRRRSKGNTTLLWRAGRATSACCSSRRATSKKRRRPLSRRWPSPSKTRTRTRRRPGRTSTSCGGRRAAP